MVNKYIPLISEGFKARANIDTKVNVHKNLIKDTVLIKDIASLKYTQSTAIPSHSTPFINNFST